MITCSFRDRLADSWYRHLVAAATERASAAASRAAAKRRGVRRMHAVTRALVSNGEEAHTVARLHRRINRYAANAGVEALCRAFPPLTADDLVLGSETSVAMQIEGIVFATDLDAL